MLLQHLLGDLQAVALGVLGLGHVGQGAQKTELRPNSYTEIWPKFDIFRVPTGATSISKGLVWDFKIATKPVVAIVG